MTTQHLLQRCRIKVVRGWIDPLSDEFAIGWANVLNLDSNCYYYFTLGITKTLQEILLSDT